MPGNIIGNVGFFTQTEADLLDIADDHIHTPALVFPSQADPVTISTTASAWNDFTEITEIWSAAEAPSSQFDIHWAIVSDISAVGDFHLKLASGESGSEVEIGDAIFSRSANQTQEGSSPVRTPRVAAGTRLSVALSSSNAAVNTIGLKMNYHVY